MAPLTDTSKHIQRASAYVLGQVGKRVEKLYAAPMKALDTLPKGISKLNELGKRMQVSDELFQVWQRKALNAASPGELHVGYPDGPQAPIKEVETFRDNTPRHEYHDSREGSSCEDAFNCHAYAVGKPIEDSYETSMLNRFKLSPESKSHPNWNHSPANELRENYFQVRPGSPTKVGDVLIYGQDFNENGRIDDLYTSPDNKLVPEISHSAVVVKVKDGKPVLCRSKRGSESAVVEHGPDVDNGLRKKYGYRMGTFRLKPQTDPQRKYEP